jgi:hypothetical protein
MITKKEIQKHGEMSPRIAEITTDKPYTVGRFIDEVLKAETIKTTGAFYVGDEKIEYEKGELLIPIPKSVADKVISKATLYEFFGELEYKILINTDMVDFNKKLKVDRINLFCDVVTKMANGTPAEGYAIGDAIKQLPENLQQYLISEVPDNILRREYARRELHIGDNVVFEGADTIAEVYKEEVFNANRAEALKDLLGIKSQFPDILDVIAEVLKCFPERYTLDDIYDMLYKSDLGL